MRIRVCMILFSLFLASSAFAQEPAPNVHAKDGFWLSAGMGFGSLGCSECFGEREGGLSGGLSLGTTINDRVLIGVGTTGFSKSYFGERLSLGTLDFRVRFYPSRTSGFHINGGLGFGNISFVGESETGAGAVIGMGWDIRMGDKKNWSLTPFWNGVGLSFDGGDANFGQIGLGLTIH